MPEARDDGRHRLRISLDDGVVVSELICPESGCEPVDGEGPAAPCWLRTWAENEDLAANYVRGALGTFVVEARWLNGAPDIRIMPPASSSAGDETPFGAAFEKPAQAGDEAREALAEAAEALAQTHYPGGRVWLAHPPANETEATR